MQFLILKAVHSEAPAEPRKVVEDLPADADKPEAVQSEVVGEEAIPDAPEPEPELRLGVSDRLDEARRFADLGKSMRLIDPERPHEAHLVGPDLADPHTWRHTLLVDDEPFTDQEFDRAEDAFLSALQTGVVPAGGPAQGPSDYDLDKPFEPEG